MPISKLLMKQHLEETHGNVEQEPEKTEPESDEPAQENPAQRVHELDKPESVVNEDQVEAEGDMDFQLRLNKLDSLIQQDFNIDSFTLGIVRAHVKQIMVDLKEQPELETILIDRDVHNILTFIRSVKNQAITAQEKKTVKREAKSKKGRIGRINIGDLELPGSLEGLGSLKS